MRAVHWSLFDLRVFGLPRFLEGWRASDDFVHRAGIARRRPGYVAYLFEQVSGSGVCCVRPDGDRLCGLAFVLALWLPNGRPPNGVV